MASSTRVSIYDLMVHIYFDRKIVYFVGEPIEVSIEKHSGLKLGTMKGTGMAYLMTANNYVILIYVRMEIK